MQPRSCGERRRGRGRASLVRRVGAADAVQCVGRVPVQVGGRAEVGLLEGSGMDRESLACVTLVMRLMRGHQFWNFKTEVSALAGDTPRQWLVLFTFTLIL